MLAPALPWAARKQEELIAAAEKKIETVRAAEAAPAAP